ncbi:MAG: hypothetical protein ACR2FY_11930 [Pirellulaceae bacterium]
MSVELNPYESPKEISVAPPTSAGRPKVNLAVVGLLLGIVALAGAMDVGRTEELVYSVGGLFIYSCVPGLVLSVIGFIARPNRLAAVGMAINFFVLLYLVAFVIAEAGPR